MAVGDGAPEGAPPPPCRSALDLSAAPFRTPTGRSKCLAVGARATKPVQCSAASQKPLMLLQGRTMGVAGFFRGCECHRSRCRDEQRHSSTTTTAWGRLLRPCVVVESMRGSHESQIPSSTFNGVDGGRPVPWCRTRANFNSRGRTLKPTVGSKGNAVSCAQRAGRPLSLRCPELRRNRISSAVACQSSGASTWKSSISDEYLETYEDSKRGKAQSGGDRSALESLSRTMFVAFVNLSDDGALRALRARGAQLRLELGLRSRREA